MLDIVQSRAARRYETDQQSFHFYLSSELSLTSAGLEFPDEGWSE